MTFFTPQEKQEELMTEKILSSLAILCVFGLMVWAVWQYAELPVVKFSMSRQEVVAVENFKGEALPFPPLPDKYKKVYVP